MRQAVADELLAVKEAYGDRRRTQIVFVKQGASKRSLLTTTDLAPDKAVWICVTPDGLISRTHEAELPPRSGGDAPAWLLSVNTRDTLYLVNEQGEAAALPLQAVPEAENVQGGVPLYKISALHSEDRLAGLFSLPHKGERVDTWFVFTATRQGMVKKSLLSELPGPSANTFTLVRVNEGDQLGWLRITDGQAEILLLTTQGMAIRFSEEEVRPMGLVAGGVMGIKLQGGDEIVGMEALPHPGEVFMLASDGSAKRVEVAQFPRQGRYGQGVQAWKLPPKVHIAGMLVGEESSKATLFFSKTAPKLARLDVAPLQGRSARGKSDPRSARWRPGALPLGAVGADETRRQPDQAGAQEALRHQDGKDRRAQQARRRESCRGSGAAHPGDRRQNGSCQACCTCQDNQSRETCCPDRGEDRQNCYDREQACQSCQNRSRSGKDGEIHRSSREVQRRRRVSPPNPHPASKQTPAETRKTGGEQGLPNPHRQRASLPNPHPRRASPPNPPRRNLSRLAPKGSRQQTAEQQSRKRAPSQPLPSLPPPSPRRSPPQGGSVKNRRRNQPRRPQNRKPGGKSGAKSSG